MRMSQTKSIFYSTKDGSVLVGEKLNIVELFNEIAMFKAIVGERDRGIIDIAQEINYLINNTDGTNTISKLKELIALNRVLQHREGRLRAILEFAMNALESNNLTGVYNSVVDMLEELDNYLAKKYGNKPTSSMRP